MITHYRVAHKRHLWAFSSPLIAESIATIIKRSLADPELICQLV